MATAELTKENFESTINDNETVIIDFWAEWCGPCRTFGPTFEAASEKHTEVKFVKVDTEAQRELAAMFQVRSIPMVVVFRQGVPVFSQPGALPAAAIDEILKEVGALDMDEVKRQYQEQVAKAQGKA